MAFRSKASGIPALKNVRFFAKSVSSKTERHLRSAGATLLLKRAPCCSFSSTTGLRARTEQNEGGERGQYNSNQSRVNQLIAAGVATFALAGGVYYWSRKNSEKSGLQTGNLIVSRLNSVQVPFSPVFAQKGQNKKPGVGEIIPGLPTYTEADVAKHSSKESGIWVIYKNGVYDVTEYHNMHPGGNKILMAAGKSMEPFWEVYSVHKNEEVFEILESLRIGNIKDVPKIKAASDANDPYRNEPERSPLLIPSSNKPFNAEPPPQLLADKFITPNHLFFVRNHLPVPCVKTDDYFLNMDFGRTQGYIKLDDLKSKFEKKSVTAVTQCAGNRRSEMVKIKPVRGLNWGSAAISNAKWSGVTLNDLFQFYGVDIDKVKEKYLVFEGLDTQPDGSSYGASISVELARLLKDDIIVAYEMNGKDIPRDHGYPVRVIIPGVVGARQVKWLNKIYFSGEESTSHWQRRDYKGFNSSIDWHNVDFDKAESITQLPVISAICEPVEGTVLEEGAEEVTVKGYAWSGGGRDIIRVDVSADGGKTWHEATLQPNGQPQYKSWAWTLWEADIPLPTKQKETTLIAKAVDVSYNVQPDSVEGIWNLRGVLSNAWHRVQVKIPAEGGKK